MVLIDNVLPEELKYIINIIFSEILNAETPFISQSVSSLTISYGANLEIRISQCVLLDSSADFSLCCLKMKSINDEINKIIKEEKLPVLVKVDSQCEEPLISVDENVITINFDLFGSAFYILTRMEEMGSNLLDEHCRFPASASHAYENGYLHRPVVDEYAEILWYCIKLLWPNMERKQKKFEMKLTHDVDEPFEALFRPAWKMVRSFGSDIIRRRDIKRAFNRSYLWGRVKCGDWKCDRAYTFDRIMDLGESVGCKDAFYFIPDCSGEMSGDYCLDHPRIRTLMNHIYERGHEIGYHGSYETYLDPAKTKNAVMKLKEIAAKEGIIQDIWGGRQHYLRWSVPQTWRNYAEAGLDYDATLSFADAAGFRCGTCHPYHVYDMENKKVLPLMEYPLTVMECSLLSEDYMGYSYERALEYMLLLKNQCRNYGGTFVFLWHNSAFENEMDWELYRNVLVG